jgi:hypothetical protein
VIQTAFEELGMRDVTQIHCELFRHTVERIGVELDTGDLRSFKPTHDLLAWLWQRLDGYVNDAAVLGVLLGLEAPARENISLIFDSIAYDTEARKALADELFFKIHFAVEEEHVRLTLSNFLRFCVSLSSKAEYVDGFDDGIEFWRRFWMNTSELFMYVTAGSELTR